jgi:hypothetical protein
LGGFGGFFEDEVLGFGVGLQENVTVVVELLGEAFLGIVDVLDILNSGGGDVNGGEIGEVDVHNSFIGDQANVIEPIDEVGEGVADDDKIVEGEDDEEKMCGES